MNAFKLIILFSILSSIARAESLEWSDLDLWERYKLNTEINFENKIIFHPGDEFEMLDQIGGDAPVIYLQFHSIKCLDPDQKSDMILINPSPEDTSRNRSIALELEEGCNLGLYLEPQDYYTRSLFDQD